MQSKLILSALAALLSFSTAQNVHATIDTNYTPSSSNYTSFNATTTAYTTLTTARPYLNDTAVANTTKIAYSTTWTFNDSASVSYSDATITAPSLTTTIGGILVATGTPTPSIITSFFIIPASSTVAQETSGSKNTATTTSSGAARKLGGSVTRILGIIGIIGYLAV